MAQTYNGLPSFSNIVETLNFMYCFMLMILLYLLKALLNFSVI